MTHDLDVLRFLDLGLPRAIGYSARGGSAEGRFALACGTDAVLNVSLEHDGRHRVTTISGSAGSLTVDYLNRTLMLRTDDGDEQLPVGDVDPLTEQWRLMLAGTPAAGVRDGLAALHAAEQVSALHRVRAL
jgi:predicted dehydrogenase